MERIEFDFTAREPAPVALFAYDNLSRLRQTIDGLARNHGASQTRLYVFSDGGRDEASWCRVRAVRDYLKSVKGFYEVRLIERAENLKLEFNVIDGVTEVVNRHERVIVLEDDVLTHANFLTFMNASLTVYEPFPRVMHISALNFIEPLSEQTILWRYLESSGWATWADRWRHFHHFESEDSALEALSDVERDTLQLGGVFPCLDTLRLSPVPWDICWYIAVVKNNGLAVSPPRSLVTNTGLHGGTHFFTGGLKGWVKRFLLQHPYLTDRYGNELTSFCLDIIEDKAALARLIDFYRNFRKPRVRFFSRTFMPLPACLRDKRNGKLE